MRISIWLAASWIGLLLHTSAGQAATPPRSGVEPTISELRAQLDSGRTTVRAVERFYADRIAALDSKGPSLHAVLEVNPDAAAIASGLDSSRTPHGALYGIPILLKDNIDTADRMRTTAGSLALMDSKPTRDAFVVQRLRASGALILGKTNLSEWANFRSKRSSSGWSGRGGQTKNPYVLDRNPCGSSAGSGAAIAANFALAALGTETNGSIVCPSSVNGLVGIKPTVGLVSRSGVIPIAASQDTPGPMTRTVADAAVVLRVIAGYDPDDPATAPLRDNPPPDYTTFLKADALKGVRIGVLRKYAGYHEGVDAVFERALQVLRERGATLVDTDIPEDEEISNSRGIVLLAEFKDGINRYLATREGGGPRTLQDLIAFNDAHADQEMPYFLQELFLDAEATQGLKDPKYLAVHERVKQLAAESIDWDLAKDHLDVLIAPTVGPAWTTDVINGHRGRGGDISSPPAIAGYPHITVPMGDLDGLPLGLSFVSTAWSEGRLIGYAYAFEQATRARRPPTFRPSLP